MQAFRRTSERGFARLGDPVPAGDLVCHVAVDPDGTRLIASCWGDGRVVAMGLDAAGRPHTPEIAASAGDPFSSGDPFAVAGESVGRAPAHPTVDAIDLAAAARALREPRVNTDGDGGEAKRGARGAAEDRRAGV